MAKVPLQFENADAVEILVAPTRERISWRFRRAVVNEDESASDVLLSKCLVNLRDQLFRDSPVIKKRDKNSEIDLGFLAGGSIESFESFVAGCRRESTSGPCY